MCEIGVGGEGGAGAINYSVAMIAIQQHCSIQCLPLCKMGVNCGKIDYFHPVRRMYKHCLCFEY